MIKCSIVFNKTCLNIIIIIINIYIYIYIHIIIIIIIPVLVVTKSLFGFVETQESQTKFHGIKYINLLYIHYIYVCVGGVFANGPGDLGSIPGRIIPKTLKMVLDTSLLNTQQYKVRIKGKVEQSRKRSVNVVAIEKGALWLPSTTFANFIYICIYSSKDLYFLQETGSIFLTFRLLIFQSFTLDIMCLIRFD